MFHRLVRRSLVRCLSTRKEPVRVAVTGAAGNIGYALIPRIASGEMLGRDQPVILHLLEVPDVMKKLEGVRMELLDCAFPLVEDVVCTDNAEVAFANCDYAMLVGAKPRTGGMLRKDLLTANAKVFQVQGKALNDVAKATCKVCVVGNPANTNALIAALNAPKIPKRNFFGLMRLDQNRAIAQLSLKLSVPQRDLHDVYVWGNHSDTQYPDATHVCVGEQRARTVVDPDWCKSVFLPTVSKRGAAIIAARGSSSAFSAADAAIKHMRDLVQGSEEVVAMAVWTDGSVYGITEGLYCGLPCRVAGGGDYEIVSDVHMDNYSREKLMASVKELLEEKEAVKQYFPKK